MLDENLQHAARLLGIDLSTLPPIVIQERIVDSDISEEPPVENDDLTDEEYALLIPSLPAEPRHGAAISNQQVLRALMWAQATTRPLTHVPSSYGSAEAIRKRSERWAVLGVGETLLRAIDGLPLRPNIKSAIKRLAGGLARRGGRIRKSRESLR